MGDMTESGHPLSADYFKTFFRKSLLDMREAANAVIVAAIIFCAGISIGMLYPSWSEEQLSALKTIAASLIGKSMHMIILTIFLKNSLAAAIAVILGPLLGIPPAFGALSNGVLLGATLSQINREDTMVFLLQLLPHGILEIPAIFMAWGIGIWQGAWFFQINRPHSFRDRTIKALRIFFIIIIPLLLCAAIIEGTLIYRLMLQKQV